MHTPTTVRYHFTAIGVARMQESANNKCWQGCGNVGAHTLPVEM